MQLTLVIPGLLDVSSSSLVESDMAAPALAHALAASPSTPIDDGDESAILCAALGVSRQSDWPIAPLQARAAGFDPERRYWLCALPATLEPRRDDVRLVGLVDDVSADEGTTLSSMFNAHFSDDGLQFFVPEPSRWLLSCDSAPRLFTKPPSAALGAPLFDHLPTGADSAIWRRWQNEIQMLLFEHPVNLAREAQGRPLINNLWLYGGGTYASPGAINETVNVFADEAWLRNVARGAGANTAPLPASLSSISPEQRGSSVLVWPSDITEPGLEQEMAAIDRDWIAPLVVSVDRAFFSSARVVVTGRGKAYSFALRKRSLMTRLTGRFVSRRLSTIIEALREH